VTPLIVHVASGREWRGGQRQVWLLARELERRGIPQVVVTGRDSELARRLSSAGVGVRSAAWRAGVDPRVVPAILGELRRTPALLHAHDSHALTLAGIGAALRRTPLVATRRVDFAIRRPYSWRRVDRVIAISAAVSRSLEAAGVPHGRVTIVPDAIDLQDVTHPGQYDIHSALGLGANGQLAVSLGDLTPEKSHSTLIEAAFLLVRDLPSLRWAVIGEGPLRERLQEQIMERGLRDRVRLLGTLPDPHVALGAADVFVLSSTSEGFGSAALAAMAAGVPVVATRVGGMPDLLGENRGLLVSPGKPAEVAAAVRQVLSQPDLRSRMISAARQEVRRYDVSAMAERVLEVYRSCAHSLRPS
jgi:glycosyltransferase involved in cell wall biosynthesis